MKWILTAVVGLSLGGPFLKAQNLTPENLQGAWRLVSLTMDGESIPATGYLFFHGQHYSFITNMPRPSVSSETRRKPLGELNDSEKNRLIEAFLGMTAAAGPYIIDGDKMSHVMEVVRSPHLVGSTSSPRKTSLDGNRLTQEFQGGDHYRVMVWERVAAEPR